MNSECCVLCALCCFFELAENNFRSLMLIGGSSYAYACMCRILVKLDWNAFRSATEVGFRPVEKAEHQGCCGRIPPESSWNRDPALDSGLPKNGTKTGMCHLAQTVAHSETSLGILPCPLAAAEGRGGRGRGGEALKPEQCIFHVEVGSQVPPVGQGVPQEFCLLTAAGRWRWRAEMMEDNNGDSSGDLQR